MPEDRHPIDALVNQMAGHPRPTDTDRAAARNALVVEMAASGPRDRPRTGRRRILTTAAIGLVLVVAAGLVVRPWAVPPAEAALLAIAELAEEVDPVLAADTSFVYTRSHSTVLAEIPYEGLGQAAYTQESLFYHYNTIRETWIGNDDTVQIAVTVLEPTFFNPADETVYYAADIDLQDQVGQRIVSTVNQPPRRSWPTDPDQLDAAIRSEMVTNRDLPESVEYLDVALDIIRESHASPKLRAETLRLIAEATDLKLLDENVDGLSTFRIGYDDNGIAKRLTFTVDTSGYLRTEQLLNLDGDSRIGIPPNTVESSSSYDQPIPTTSLSDPSS